MFSKEELRRECMYSWMIEREEPGRYYKVFNTTFKVCCKYIKEEKWPVTTRMFQEVHKSLFGDGRIRTCGVTIGGDRGCSPELIHSSLKELDDWFNEDKVFTYEDIAIAHWWFESIHPFIDGNGRTGRFMIPLMCIAKGLEPVFMSKYFYNDTMNYYRSFTAYRQGHELSWYKEWFVEGTYYTI